MRGGVGCWQDNGGLTESESEREVASAEGGGGERYALNLGSPTLMDSPEPF
jgi:hypothetical protein